MRQGKDRQPRAAGLLASRHEEPIGRGSIDDAEINSLLELDTDGLRARWRSEFGRVVPGHLTRPLMARVLAYRLQADALGDLPVSTVQLMESLLRAAVDISGGAKAALPEYRHLSVGATLVREHGGKRHHVRVIENGFVWNGTVYPSLTKVAHAITGTNWNGPRFFGLRDKARAGQ